MSNAISAQYGVRCPACGAGAKEPCRTKKTDKVTDTHSARRNLYWAVRAASRR